MFQHRHQLYFHVKSLLVEGVKGIFCPETPSELGVKSILLVQGAHEYAAPLQTFRHAR